MGLENFSLWQKLNFFACTFYTAEEALAQRILDAALGPGICLT